MAKLPTLSKSSVVELDIPLSLPVINLSNTPRRQQCSEVVHNTVGLKVRYL
jgi:hypothetical protein